MSTGMPRPSLGGGVADVHPGPFADGLEPLELVDLGGIVITRRLRGKVVFFGFGHGGNGGGREGKNRAAKRASGGSPEDAVFAGFTLAENLERSRLWSPFAPERRGFFDAG
jgi:hypothetical protein